MISVFNYSTALMAMPMHNRVVRLSGCWLLFTQWVYWLIDGKGLYTGSLHFRERVMNHALITWTLSMPLIDSWRLLLCYRWYRAKNQRKKIKIDWMQGSNQLKCQEEKSLFIAPDINRNRPPAGWLSCHANDMLLREMQ